MRIDNRDGYLRDDSYNRLYKRNGGRGMAFRKQTKGGRKWTDQYGGHPMDNSGKWPLHHEEYGEEETPYYLPVCGTGSTQSHLLHHTLEGMPLAWGNAHVHAQESPNAAALAQNAAAAAATDFGGGGGGRGDGSMGMESSYYALMGPSHKNYYDITLDGNINHHAGNGGIEALSNMMMMGDHRSVPTGHFGRQDNQRYGSPHEEGMEYGFEPPMRLARRAGKWSPRTTSPRTQKRSFHATFSDAAASNACFAAATGFPDSHPPYYHNTSTSSSSQAHLPHHIAWISDPWNPPAIASNGGPRPAATRSHQGYGNQASSRGNCATFGNNRHGRGREHNHGRVREHNHRWQSPVRVNDKVWMENRTWGTVIKIGNARNQVLVRSSDEDREIFWCDCSKYRQTWSVKVTLCVSMGFVSRALPPNAASLQFRDITPQDYDLLCALDENIPSRKCMPTEYIDNLSAGECGSMDCGVCLETIGEDGDPRVLPCPMKHQFHYECIKTWLAKGNTCPLDMHILDGSDNDGSDAKDIKKEDNIASIEHSTSTPASVRNDNEE